MHFISIINPFPSFRNFIFKCHVELFLQTMNNIRMKCGKKIYKNNNNIYMIIHEKLL